MSYLVCYKYYTLLSTVKSFCETGTLTLEKMKKANCVGLTLITVTSLAIALSFGSIVYSVRDVSKIAELPGTLHAYYYIVTFLSLLLCAFLIWIFFLLKFAIARASDRGTLGVKRVLGLILSQMVNCSFLLANIFVDYDYGTANIVANMTQFTMYTIFCLLIYFLAKDVVTDTYLKSVVSHDGEVEIAAYDINGACLFQVTAINSQGNHLIESKNEKV